MFLLLTALEARAQTDDPDRLVGLFLVHPALENRVVRCGDRAVPRLLEGLRAKERAPWPVCRALARIGSKGARSALAEVAEWPLEPRKEAWPTSAACALSSLGDRKGTARLVAILTGDEPRNRARALRIVPDFSGKYPASLDAVVLGRFREGELAERIDACHAIVHLLGLEKAKPHLREALDDEVELRVEAARWLGAEGLDAAAGVALDETAELRVRLSAVGAIAAIGGEAAEAHLLEVFAGTSNDQLKLAALQPIGLQGGWPAVKRLIELDEQGHSVRRVLLRISGIRFDSAAEARRWMEQGGPLLSPADRVRIDLVESVTIRSYGKDPILPEVCEMYLAGYRLVDFRIDPALDLTLVVQEGRLGRAAQGADPLAADLRLFGAAYRVEGTTFVIHPE